MADDPNTGEDKPLEPPTTEVREVMLFTNTATVINRHLLNTPCNPAANLSPSRAKVLNSMDTLEVWIDQRGELPGNSSHQDVAGEIEQSARSVTNEQMGRNLGSNRRQGEGHRGVLRKIGFSILRR